MKTPSTSREIVGAKNQPLDPLTAGNSIHDFGHVGHSDPPVKEMIGLDQNANSTRALVETARSANACLELGESARGELFF